MATIKRKAIRRLVHARIRKTLRGTAERPRLAVHFSNQRVYAQLINDDEGKTIVSASTIEAALASKAANVANATKVGEAIAERALEKNITSVVFDRGGFFFHGKVKALADAARAKGLQF
ncbi:50S ribosomal protein L18 [Verrucomicrobium spinosum]|jgi:large subunit ribosomal protein L18|uniref:50S ribosomal protein L18 n=1 Tax=Verrucomicrobium spinosum TaxID=2736 RepID=UPI0001744E63|nr:50S ribosomal protein L18 [Verrucomicrobium spinosum]